MRQRVFVAAAHNFQTVAKQKGLALLPLVLAIAVAGALMGAGLKLVGPKVDRLRTQTAISQLDHAASSVVAWSLNNGRLPTAAEFVAAIGIQDDPWKQSLVYVYDGNLSSSATGGVCGRETTGLSLDGTSDMAFAIISGGENFAVDAAPNTTGAHTGNLTSTPLDLTKGVPLNELQSRAGCFDRTTGRLVLLNNELPEGCTNGSYTGELFAAGGVASYSWVGTTVPSWLTLTPSGDSCELSGSPSTPGTYLFEISLSDAAGSQTDRRFNILVADCSTAPGQVSQWDFEEGSGGEAEDGVGSNDGTLVGDTAWSSDTPDGTGSSLFFDGEGDYVHVSDSDSLNITGEVTLMAWVKETATGQYAKVVSRRTGYYFYFLGVDNGNPYGGIGESSDYTVTGKSLLMSLDRWNHLTMVYNDAKDLMFLHFDGTERMSTVSESLPARAGVDVAIGGDSQGFGSSFDGDIDNVTIYNRVLTDAEIRGVMNGTSYSGLVASYGFDGTLEDGGAGGHDGTLNGAVFTTDRSGLPNSALELDGHDRVIVDDHSDFQLTGGLTLTAWIRERSSKSHARIVSRRKANYFYYLGVDDGRPYGGIGDGSHSTETRKSIAMIPDQWHFLAFVYDDAEDSMRIFFNGTLDETATSISLPDISDVDLTIGADFEGNQYFFTGYIDQVMVFDRALDVDEIRDGY